MWNDGRSESGRREYAEGPKTLAGPETSKARTAVLFVSFDVITTRAYTLVHNVACRVLYAAIAAAFKLKNFLVLVFCFFFGFWFFWFICGTFNQPKIAEKYLIQWIFIVDFYQIEFITCSPVLSNMSQCSCVSLSQCVCVYT